MAVLASLYASAHTPKTRRKPAVSDFMYKDPETRREENVIAADKYFEMRRKYG